MRDKDKGHAPDWPKRKVDRLTYESARRKEERSRQTFVWVARGIEHVATVSYDTNGMAIGVQDNGECYLYD